MTRKAFLLIPLIALLAGCGGSGGGSGPASLSGYGPVSADSPYQGAWEGRWWDYLNPADALRVTVQQDGRFTGEIEDPFIPTAAAVTGNIRDDGTVAATYQFPDRDRVTVTGRLSLRSANELAGVLRARSAGGGRDIDVVISRQ